jgi:hypothetical protein
MGVAFLPFFRLFHFDVNFVFFFSPFFHPKRLFFFFFSPLVEV